MHNFDFVKPSTIAEAVKALTQDGAQALSGGQTLTPTMKQRLAAPSVLVSLTGIPEMKGVCKGDGGLSIGAATPHAVVAKEAAAHYPALAKLAGGIGDPAVRNRGTIGGSLANNDPSACYPSAALASGATIVTDRRSIAADDYFQGLFTTALDEGEIITEVKFPIPQKAAYVKFDQPASRFALVGVFVAKFADGVRVAVTGASNNGVFRWTQAEAALSANFAPAALSGLTVASDDMIGDLFGTPEYRAHLVKVLTGRAVAAAVSALPAVHQVGRAAGEGGVIVLDHRNGEIAHEVGKAALVAEGGLQPQLAEVGGHRTGDAADQVDAAEGQMDQREIAEFLSEDPGIEPGGRGRVGIVRGKRRHDLGRRPFDRRALARGDEGMEVFQPPAGQHILDAGKTVGVGPPACHEVRQRQIVGRAHRHGDVPAFRGGDDPPPGGFVHRCRVHAGSQPDHQFGGMRLHRPRDQRAQQIRRDMAERVALGLEVVQDGRPFGPGGPGKRRAVDHPVEVGHRRDPVADRSGGCDAGAVHVIDSGVLHEAAQDRIDTGEVGVAEPGDRSRAHGRAIGQGHTGIRASDVGDQQEGRIGHRVGSVSVLGQGPVSAGDRALAGALPSLCLRRGLSGHRPGPGPVELPMISSASSRCLQGPQRRPAIRSSSICAASRPASRTEDRVAVKIGSSSPLRR